MFFYTGKLLAEVCVELQLEGESLRYGRRFSLGNPQSGNAPLLWARTRRNPNPFAGLGVVSSTSARCSRSRRTMVGKEGGLWQPHDVANQHLLQICSETCWYSPLTFCWLSASWSCWWGSGANCRKTWTLHNLQSWWKFKFWQSLKDYIFQNCCL